MGTIAIAGREFNLLCRFPAQRDDFNDIAEEYALVEIDVPPGVMLWSRVENKWTANPSPREALRQLYEAGRSAWKESTK